MKKIILIICLMFINSKIKAADVIIIENGVGTVEDLEFENLQLVSNDVNFISDGIYEATYYDQLNKKYLSKEVHVIKSEDLINGYMTNHINSEINLSSDYLINDYLIKDDYTLIVGSKKSNDPIKQTEFIQNYGYIKCYKKDVLVWDINYDKYSEVVKIIETSTGFMFLSTIQTDGDYTDIELKEVNIDGTISRTKRYSGESYEMGIDLLQKNNNLYMVYYTYSKTGDLSHFYGTRVIGISKIDLYSLEVIKSKFIGNNYSTLFLDIEYCDYYNLFYILFETNGVKGDYQNNGSYVGNFIVNFDENFENSRYVGINNIYNIKDIGIENSDLYLYSISGNTLIQRIYNNHLRYIKTINRSIDSAFAVKSIKLNDYSFIYTLDYANKGVSLLDISRDKYNNHLEDEILFKVINDQLVSMTRSNNDVIIRKFYLAEELISGEVEFNYQTFNNQTIYIDGNYYNNYGPQSYNGNFGTYSDKVIIDGVYSRVILSNRYFIKENINVKNSEIYDEGKKLVFNGIGFLNDQEITSGYIINEVGNYSLLIVGSNMNKSFNFKVMNLSTRYPSQIHNSYEFDVEVIEEEVNTISTSFDKMIILKSSLPSFVFTITLSLVGALLGVIIPIGRRKI